MEGSYTLRDGNTGGSGAAGPGGRSSRRGGKRYYYNKGVRVVRAVL